MIENKIRSRAMANLKMGNDLAGIFEILFLISSSRSIISLKKNNNLKKLYEN